MAKNLSRSVSRDTKQIKIAQEAEGGFTMQQPYFWGLLDKEMLYFNISDLAAAAGRDSMEIPNWLRGLATVEFIEEWEKKRNYVE